jgi:hypothetical protein
MLISVIGASVGVDGERAQQSCRESGRLNHSVLQLQFEFIDEATKIGFQTRAVIFGSER